MVEKHDSVFPWIDTDEGYGSYTREDGPGLTKRELIAAMVLQGMVAAGRENDNLLVSFAVEDGATYPDERAKAATTYASERAEAAVRQADALLARLEAEPDPEEGGARG